jgi:hypothetical protein
VNVHRTVQKRLRSRQTAGTARSFLRPLPNLLAVFLLLLIVPVTHGQEKTVLFHEQFSSLDKWRPYYFSKTTRHSLYTIEREGDHRYLRAESNASASAIVYQDAFSVYDYPEISWRWKVSNVYRQGNVSNKAGDDCPIRVYVLFEYDPNTAGTFEKIKYGLMKKIYGEYPPQSSLNYVWANKTNDRSIVSSPYTERSKMVLLRKGSNDVGTWQEEHINIVDDYQKAFGRKPPSRAKIAIMNDSDNTGEHSVSYVADIEVFRFRGLESPGSAGGLLRNSRAARSSSHS